MITGLTTQTTISTETKSVHTKKSGHSEGAESSASASSSTSSTSSTSSASSASTASTVSSSLEYDDTAAVYEKSSVTSSTYSASSSSSSSSTSTSDSTSKTDENSAIVSKLKADQEARLSSLKSLVEKLITKQGKTFAWANSTNDDLMNDSEFWNNIREGNFEVDEETVAQAQEDISEDGYWGSEQTSDRLVDFAKSLTGGDASKYELMKDAIDQGFEEAKKLWGGELPELSQETYDKTMEKLKQWAQENGVDVGDDEE